MQQAHVTQCRMARRTFSSHHHRTASTRASPMYVRRPITCSMSTPPDFVYKYSGAIALGSD